MCAFIDIPEQLTPAAEPPAAVRTLVYSHTHWDREWYRTFERYRMQLVGVIDRLLDVLDSDASFHCFVLDGQSIVLDDYLDIRPEELPRLRRLIRAGRIEIGPWYILPDEFLVSGEALVRNLLIGRRDCARFATPSHVGYLPDPFGHVAQLPAILRGFGLDSVVFSRGLGDEIEHTGTEFRWLAPSGDDVLAIAQVSTFTSGYCNGQLMARGARRGDARVREAMEQLLPRLRDISRTGVLVVAAGCDHETIDDELPGKLADLRDLADMEHVGLAQAVDVIAQRERELDALGRPLERLTGELRHGRLAPILSSIFSARIPLKQDNDELQMLLERHAEPLLATAVWAGVRPRADVEPFLDHAWRLVLQNQPHDSIGGCSIDAVHDEMAARTLRARALIDGLLEDVRIAGQLGGVDVVHDATGRGGIIDHPSISGALCAVAPGSEPGRFHPLDDCVLRPTDTSPHLDITRVEHRDGQALRVTTPDGQVALVSLVTESDVGDEYDFGRVDGEAPRTWRVTDLDDSTVQDGVCRRRATAELTLPFACDETTKQRGGPDTTLRASIDFATSSVSPLVHARVTLTDTAHDHRVRLRVERIDAGSADTATVLARGHFADIERTARPAMPTTRWRQLPPGLDHCCGAVQLNPAAADSMLLAGRGLQEYEARSLDATGPVGVELTLLRCIGMLSRKDILGRPGHAGPALAVPGAQCDGTFVLDCALGLGPQLTLDDAEPFLVPPLAIRAFGIGQAQDPGSGDGKWYRHESGSMARARDVLRASDVAPGNVDAAMRSASLHIDSGAARLSACKLADDGSGDIVVRAWLPAWRAATATMQIVAPGALVERVQRARLDETPLGPLEWDDESAGRVRVRVAPGRIVTLRFVRRDAVT